MTILTDAYVLRKSQRGDNDRQYVLFAKDLGKISVLAKGAMKVSSKLAPHLDYFYLTEVMAAPGRIFYRLAGARIKTAFLKADDNLLKRHAACFYLEAVDNLLADKSPDAAVFEAVGVFFRQLEAAATDRGIQLALNRAVFDLLSHLGYQPPLSAGNQLELTRDLNRLLMAVSDRENRSYGGLERALMPA